MATIRKRNWTTAAGEERAAWVANYVDQEGKRRLKTFKTKKAADAWLVQARGEVAARTHVPDSISRTLREAATAWLKACHAAGLERSTLQQYQQHVTLHILPALASMRLNRLGVPEVRRFAERLHLGEMPDGKPRSPAMVGKVLTTLGMILADAAERQWCLGNPVPKARGARATKAALKRHKRRPEAGRDFPAPSEVKALLDTAPPRWRAFLVVAVFTGLRASELRGLRWQDIDLDTKILRVRQRADAWAAIGPPKSAGSRRDVPMSPMVVNSLREWKLACPPGELVFPTGTGKIERHSNIRRALTPILVKAGLAGEDGKPKYGLHAFRHFFASWLIDQGFGPKRVQSLMGHASIQMTFDVYGHLLPQEDDHEKFATGELAVVG